MSFFGGSSNVGRSYSDSERRKPHHSSNSHSRGHSPTRSTTSGYYVRPSANRSSSSSFFGGGGGGGYGNFGSSRGIFSSGGGGSGSSYYKRRPRDGYISYLMHKLQRMIKELWYYARRHPVKAFFAVVVPLLSAGGAIHGLLRQFNVRLPFIDGATSYSRGAGGYYGSSGYGGSSGGGLGGLGGLMGGGGGGGGLMENAGSLLGLAKAFM